VPDVSAPRLTAIVLAAGPSTRLGRAKQLLAWPATGEALVRRAARVARSAAGRAVVVVGAREDEVRAALDGLDVDVVVSEAWARGMGASLRAGVAAASAEDGPSACDAVLVTTCDQPLVGEAELAALARAHAASPSSPAAAAYGGVVGPPAIFPRRLFEDLLAIPDGAGARRVLDAHAASLVAVDMPAAARDVDTEDAYRALVTPRP